MIQLVLTFVKTMQVSSWQHWRTFIVQSKPGRTTAMNLLFCFVLKYKRKTSEFFPKEFIKITMKILRLQVFKMPKFMNVQTLAPELNNGFQICW